MQGGVGHNSGQVPGNWIAVSRDMRDHPIVGMGQPVKPEDPSRGSFSRYEAWQDLLMEAKWKPFEVSNKGKVVTLRRGQLMAARAWLARRWNWSEKTVRGFLHRLEAEFMVIAETGQSFVEERSAKGQSKGQRSGHYSNVLTICNYDIYQTVAELDEALKGQIDGQSRARADPVEGQSRASQGPESNKETNKQDTTLSARDPLPRSKLEGAQAREQSQSKPLRVAAAVASTIMSAAVPFLPAVAAPSDPPSTAESAQAETPYEALKAKLMAAGGEAIGTAPGLEVLSLPRSWLRAGCSLEDDILPAIRARSAKMPPRSIQSWGYFTQAVADAKAARLAPMPPGQATRAHAGSAKSWDERRQESQNDWLYADLANRQRKGPMRPRVEADE